MPLSEPIRRRLILALADQEDGQEFIDVEVALIEAEAGFWR